MKSDQESCSEWDRSTLVNENYANFRDTFCQDPADSKLQVTRFYENIAEDGNERPGYCVHPSPITFSDQIEYYAEQPDLCQVFGIYRKHSYSRLYITRELFETFIRAYSIFPSIWQFVAPFRFQLRGDVGLTPFKFRQLETDLQGNYSFECAYNFHYAALNHRESLDDNPDFERWSIRQTAVYQQYQRTNDKMTFVLITPSDVTKECLDKAVLRSRSAKKQLHAFDLHQILISTLHENWGQYIQSLENMVKDQGSRFFNSSNHVILAEVQCETESNPWRPDSGIEFLDRQRMRMIEDKILDLVLIFESLQDTLSQLQRQCRRQCLGPRLCENCNCTTTIEELKDQMRITRINLKRVEVLYKRAQSTTQLFTSFLDHQNARKALLNDKSLNGLVKETKDEHAKMRTLTETSARDATAVRILTVITIIYLPMTTVANFFSTQLIRVDGSGKVSLISESWWFAVITIPLTVVTFLVWKYWLSTSIKRRERGEEDDSSYEESSKNMPWKRGLSVQQSSYWIGRVLSAPSNGPLDGLPMAMP